MVCLEHNWIYTISHKIGFYSLFYFCFSFAFSIFKLLSCGALWAVICYTKVANDEGIVTKLFTFFLCCFCFLCVCVYKILRRAGKYHRVIILLFIIKLICIYIIQGV